MKNKAEIAIVGSGPAALMAAYVLAPHARICVYEKSKTIGRKFLVAGKGGFNLSNEAEGAELCRQYQPRGFLDASLRAFDSAATRNWLAQLGIPTYVGSSGRIFPEKHIKPYQVLQSIRNHLLEQGVVFHTRHHCIDFDQNTLEIMGPEGPLQVSFDFCLFALGGASWPVTGSDGSWTAMFTTRGLPLTPFAASNCGVNVDWPDSLVQFHAGKPLKNLFVKAGTQGLRGEVLITRYGLEGNAIYPLIPTIRQLLEETAQPNLYLDLKPNNSQESLKEKAERSDCVPGKYTTIFKLDAASMALIKACTDKKTFQDPLAFAGCLKKLPVPVRSIRPLEEAISSAGGLAISALHPDFSLRAYPRIYAIGEMVDWDAPTGGFLLQACFSMGYSAAQSIISSLQQV